MKIMCVDGWEHVDFWEPHILKLTKALEAFVISLCSVHLSIQNALNPEKIRDWMMSVCVSEYKQTGVGGLQPKEFW